MPTQQNTLHLYGELLARTPTTGWSGKLILTTGPASSATGLPAAACIAGATLLTIDPDPTAVRATFRDAGLDFLVNTLDEALRVLKNEIRQHRPLAVALTTDVPTALAEAAARGLLPDLTINAPEAPGRHHLTLTNTPTNELTTWLATHNWQQHTLPPTTPPPAFPPHDPRHTWLRNLPRYQRSTTREPRLLWLTPEEAAALA
jgi:hypothetical protein